MTKQEYVFSGCTLLPDSKESDLGRSDFLSAFNNTGIVSVPFCAWKCVPTAIFSGVDIPEVPGCHLLQKMSTQCRSQKLLQR